MMRRILLLLLLPLTVTAGQYFDYDAALNVLQGDEERGAVLAAQTERFGASCNDCHMEGGNHYHDMHPKLSGQNEAYLTQQMVAFIFLKRQSHIMNAVLVDFEKEKPRYTEQEIVDLAAWFNSL